jgi:nitrate/nitrite-specific signal transduction histidine kinase
MTCVSHLLAATSEIDGQSFGDFFTAQHQHFSRTMQASAAHQPTESSMDFASSLQARQRLLFMCACCGDDHQLRYYTAALMDEVLSILGCNLALAPAEDQSEQLLLMTCACMLIAAGIVTECGLLAPRLVSVICSTS